jgi:hypothetical protein
LGLWFKAIQRINVLGCLPGWGLKEFLGEAKSRRYTFAGLNQFAKQKLLFVFGKFQPRAHPSSIVRRLYEEIRFYHSLGNDMERGALGGTGSPQS